MSFSVLMSIYKNDDLNLLLDSVLSINKFLYDSDDFVIVVDGPGTEEHVSLVKKVLPSEKLRFLFLENNLGLGKALYHGLKFCKNEFVYRMDSDDVCVSSRLANIHHDFSTDENIAVIGSFIKESYGPNIPSKIRKVPLLSNDLIKYSKLRNPMNHVTVCLRKSYVLNVGSYEHCPSHEDYDLWIRLMQSGYKIVNKPEVWVYVNSGPSQMVRRRSNSYFKNELFFIKKNLSWFGFYSIIYLLLRFPVRILPLPFTNFIYSLIRKFY